MRLELDARNLYANFDRVSGHRDFRRYTCVHFAEILLSSFRTCERSYSFIIIMRILFYK